MMAGERGNMDGGIAARYLGEGSTRVFRRRVGKFIRGQYAFVIESPSDLRAMTRNLTQAARRRRSVVRTVG